MANSNISIKTYLVVMAAFVFPWLWHYMGLMATEFNIFAILSVLGMVGVISIYSFIFGNYMKKIQSKRTVRKKWQLYLTKILIPIIFGICSLIFFKAIFYTVDQLIIKNLESGQTSVIVTEKTSTTGKKNRIVGYYYFYEHDNYSYPGVAKIENYTPGDSLKITYSILFPSIRKIEKIN